MRRYRSSRKSKSVRAPRNYSGHKGRGKIMSRYRSARGGIRL